jgi:Arc/MetJ-type ribon-helix-helix transcriptional regulator
MEKPSLSLPRWMLDEIEHRREKGSNRSEYVREALQARFDAEDDGEWETPECNDSDGREAPADD